jgi:hypothetical protein
MVDKWWYKMMNLRSYKSVILWFARYFPKYNNFDAVVKTAEKYEYADLRTVTLMLSDLGVININYNTDEVVYDEDRLHELLEYMMDE